jgi:arylsulfatase B
LSFFHLKNFSFSSYSNHIVGKWHLGSFKRTYTPLMRGFDSHIGPWTGHHDYFDHTAEEKGMWGLDMRRGFDVAYDLHGQYTTDVITKEAVKIIQNRNSSQPLFLYVAHTAVHSSNPYSPLPAPDETVAKINNIDDYNRRKFAAMMYHLDQSVGAIVEALTQAKMLSNSIIVFSTDNGGPAAGFNLNAASNYPLRGVKNTLWEGGIRGAGFIWSPLLKTSQSVANQMFHISDWMPTLLYAAGYAVNSLDNIDGLNMWNILSDNKQSARTEILHNIDNIWGSSSIMVDKWKLVAGTNYNGQWDGWYGPAGDRDESSYQINDLLTCKTAKALKSIQVLPTSSKIM